MFKRLGELPVGTLVKDPETTHFGKPIVWKIADKNHSGYPSNTVTLISDKILSIKAFDGKESRNSNSDRQNYGNNYYKNSNLLQWLNSGSSNWYSAQHGADAPPNSNNVNTWNPYDSEPGFLYNFSSDFKNAMVSTSLKTVRHRLDGGGSETVTSKIFLASTTEVGLDNENGIAEGTRFPIFDGNESRKAYPTPEAVSKSNYSSTSLTASNPWWWWLRTPYASNSYNVRIVSSDGSLHWYNACSGRNGVRPLCNLKSEILVSNSTDSDGAYTIEWNQPPQITSSSGNNLGTKNGSFSVKYKVADPDEKGNLSVEEYLDDNKIRNFTASPGSEHSIKLEQSKYFELKNGDHELKVKVKDSSGGDAQKTFKFNKNETEILFELDKPLDADDMPTKAMINWQGKVPKEATVTIEICNNGYDKNPTWEDVSEKVALKRKYFLSNKEKTADKWGLNVRVNIKRNGAKGDCYISSIGGNFE